MASCNQPLNQCHKGMTRVVVSVATGTRASTVAVHVTVKSAVYFSLPGIQHAYLTRSIKHTVARQLDYTQALSVPQYHNCPNLSFGAFSSERQDTLLQPNLLRQRLIQRQIKTRPSRQFGEDSPRPSPINIFAPPKCIADSELDLFPQFLRLKADFLRAQPSQCPPDPGSPLRACIPPHPSVRAG